MIKKWCWFVKINVFSSIFSGARFFFFPGMFVSSACTDKKQSLCSMNKQTLPSWYFFTIQDPRTCLRTVFPTRDQQLDVRMDFVREVPQGLRCLPKMSAICVVEDVSICLDILTFEFWAICECPPIPVECKLTLRRLLVRHNLATSQQHPITCAVVTLDADKPCKLRRLQCRLLQCHHGTRLCHCIFAIGVLTPCFFEVTNVHQWSKGDFFLLFELRA